LNQQIASQAAQGPYAYQSLKSTPNSPQHIIVMGVSGCGKSTLASAIAAYLGWDMLEGDAFHPAANLTKMAAGQPLSDEDRQPWLLQLNQKMRERHHIVLSCSALKATYRSTLSHDLPAKPLFVHAHGSFDSLLTRMQQREDHFMPASLLRSQFEALEMPCEAELRCVTVSTNDSTAVQVSQLIRFLDD
jgi:gluconokinase